MIDLNKYYIAKKYAGPSGTYPSVGGFVPPATSGDSSKFLRGDGSWAEAGKLNYTLINSSQLLSKNNKYAVDTSSGPFAIDLPANPETGDEIEIFDSAGYWHFNNLTVRNSNKHIAGKFGYLTCNVQHGIIKLVYIGETYGWRIIPLPKHSEYFDNSEFSSTTKFAVLGDGQAGDLQAEQILSQLIPSYNPEYIVHVGDINQSIDPSVPYQEAVARFQDRFIANWSGTNLLDKIYLAPGNHDLDSSDYGAYIIESLPATSGAIGSNKLDQKLYCYDFRKGPVHFFVMNAGNTSAGNDLNQSDSLLQFNTQIADLTPKIQNSNAPWKVLVIHKPPYTLGTTHRPGANILFNKIDFNGLGIDITFHGHAHTYELWKFDDPNYYPNVSNFNATGTYFIVNGLGGVDFRGAGTAPSGALQSVYYQQEAFINVSATATGFHYDLITTGNQIVDSRTFTKNVPAHDLNKEYYSAQVMSGASSSSNGREGFVPRPIIGDNEKFLRGDGAWSDPTISRIQYIENSNNIILDVDNYSTFVVNLTESATFTYSGFENGKSINIYLVANHAGHLPHTFPPNTVFAELGDDNIIYSFQDYTTRILLQDVGSYVYNFSSVVRTPINPYYYYNNPIAGIGIDLLDLYLN